jgi:hypothetical protein
MYAPRLSVAPRYPLTLIVASVSLVNEGEMEHT